MIAKKILLLLLPIVIGIVLQLENLNYYKLLHLLNVTKIYYTLQNYIIATRYKSNIIALFYIRKRDCSAV